MWPKHGPHQDECEAGPFLTAEDKEVDQTNTTSRKESLTVQKQTGPQVSLRYTLTAALFMAPLEEQKINILGSPFTSTQQDVS